MEVKIVLGSHIILKKYDLNILLVRFDHGFLRKNLNENVKKLCKSLGLNLLSYRPNWKITQKLMLKSLIDKGDFVGIVILEFTLIQLEVALRKKFL